MSALKCQSKSNRNAYRGESNFQIRSKKSCLGVFAQRGFSLLELLVVMSILVVLAAVAVPSYERYITRAKATELIVGINPYKTAMVEWYAENAGATAWPSTQSRINWPTSTAGEYLRTVSFQRAATTSRGAIKVTGEIEGKSIVFFAEGHIRSGKIIWVCTSPPKSREFLPQACANDVSSGLS